MMQVPVEDPEGALVHRRLRRAIKAIAMDVTMYGMTMRMPEMADGYAIDVGTISLKAVIVPMTLMDRAIAGAR